MLMTYRGRTRLLLSAVATVAAAGVARTAAAADRYWVGGTNFWELPGLWSATPGGAGGAGMPGNGDAAYIVSSTNITVTRDGITGSYLPPGPSLVQVTG